MAGVGEAERETNGLSAGDKRSVLLSDGGDGVVIPEEQTDGRSSSIAPSLPCLTGLAVLVDLASG